MWTLRRIWRIAAVALGCILLGGAVVLAGFHLNLGTGVSVSDFVAVGMTASALVVSLFSWNKQRIDTAKTESDALAAPQTHEDGTPRQLPGATSYFVGRGPELRHLSHCIEPISSARHGVRIVIIHGSAGVGKTALAVHWAHSNSSQFPDGQLYLNLRGFDSDAVPMVATDAIQASLAALNVSPERVPSDLEAQSSLFRSVLAGKEILIILDNARNAAQVRPLLPGAPGCVVIVTSRSRLTSLIAAEGAMPLNMTTMNIEECRELLRVRIGDRRVATDPEAVDKIIHLCSQLPLTLSLVGARASILYQHSLAQLAAELEASHGTLAAFESDDSKSDLSAIFSWSYEKLAADSAKIFRLLGLLPALNFTPTLIGALGGVSKQNSLHILRSLADSHLVAEETSGRFSIHELLKEYARELCLAQDALPMQRTARERMLDYYLHTAYAATSLVYPRWEPFPIAPTSGDVPVEVFRDHQQALSWIESEYTALNEILRIAFDSRLFDYAWQLPLVLADFFSYQGRWTDWLDAQKLALAASEHGQNAQGQARVHGSLGRALAWLGQYTLATQHLQRSIEIFEALDDVAGQADSWNAISEVLEQQGKPRLAVETAHRALTLFRFAKSSKGIARVLNNIGWNHALLGEPDPAIWYCQHALTLARNNCDFRTEADILDSLGYAHLSRAEYGQAIDFLTQSSTLKTELGLKPSLAGDLAHLGDAHMANGHPVEARRAWKQSISILDELGDQPFGVGAAYPKVDDLLKKISFTGANANAPRRRPRKN